MPTVAEHLISSLVGRWQNASAHDFGVLALSTVVIAWFISKYYAD